MSAGPAVRGGRAGRGGPPVGRRRGWRSGRSTRPARRSRATSTAGVKRQYMGCAGRVANGINTVHLSYVREKTGHALVGARQWIPAEDIEDPVKSPGHGPAAGPAVPHQGRSWPSTSSRTRYGDGAVLRLRLRRRGLRHLHRAAGVPGRPRPGLRAARRLELHPHSRGRHHADLRGGGEEAAEAQAAAGRSAPPGTGSKGERWYAWAWLATASPRHSLLVRRHLKTGELAFHYCFVPDGPAGVQGPADPGGRAALARGGELRAREGLLRPGPVPGPALHRDPAAHRAGHGRPGDLRRHRRPLRDRTDAQAPPPARPGPAAPPADPGLIPLTVREIRRLLASATARPKPPGHAARWLDWRRRHQARSRWFHKHARLQRDYALVS